MKLRYTLFMLPAVLLVLAGCGSKEGELEDAAPAGSTASSSQTPNSGGSSPVIPPATPSDPDCNPQAVSGILSATVDGSYNQTKTAITIVNGVDPMPDQKLRVRIIPGQASDNSQAGGANHYTKMSARVKLYKGSSLLKTFVVPSQSGSGTYGNTIGLPVGQASEPVDFSAYLTSTSGNYYIKVDQIKTDYTCNTFYADYYWACYYWGYYDPSYCTDLNSFTTMQCDVGPAQSTSTWSLSVEAETDFTQCF